MCRKVQLMTPCQMRAFALGVTSVQDYEARSRKSALVVEEPERCRQKAAVIAAHPFKRAKRATGLDRFLQVQLGVARAIGGPPQVPGKRVSSESLQRRIIRLLPLTLLPCSCRKPTA